MSTAELINYYANLLILQYRGKPKAFATIQDLVEMVIMDQLPLAVQNAFNPITAAGQQLDFICKYVGVSRFGSDLSGNLVTLGDSDLRSLMNIAIIQNAMDASLDNIQTLLATFFPGIIEVSDYGSMHGSYFYRAPLSTNIFAEFFIKAGRLPRPMAVQMSLVILAPTGDEYFGLRTYDIPAYNSTPMNDYPGGFVQQPWLSYTQALAI